MKLSTYHSHTTFCDGKNTPEEMVQKAIELKCPEFGFSGHSPIYEVPTQWAIKDEAGYIKEITRLKEKYKGTIDIFMGLEQDLLSNISKYKYDYLIGAVHYVPKGNLYLPVDASSDKMVNFVNSQYKGDVYEYCEDYYSLMEKVYEKTKCNIIAHFDLVTKFNEINKLIDTSEKRYIKAANKALDVLLKTDAIFEINTGAISRGYRTEAYPEKWMIDKIANANKKFVINSDTHSCDTIDCKFDEVKKYLDDKGYEYITSLREIL